MVRSVAPAAYFIARIKTESKSFCAKIADFLTDASGSNLKPAMSGRKLKILTLKRRHPDGRRRARVSGPVHARFLRKWAQRARVALRDLESGGDRRAGLVCLKADHRQLSPIARVASAPGCGNDRGAPAPSPAKLALSASM